VDSQLIAVVALSLLIALPATAQNAPSDKQRQLNRDAYSAMNQGQTDVAVQLYEESLAIAPLNVTYLNLGRAHQKAGRCDEAWSAFDSVPTAPTVEKPAPDKIAAAHVKFTDELVGSCPTRVEVRCGNEGAEVSIAGDRRACPALFDLTPGTHEVRMTWSVVQLQKTVYLGPGRRVLVEFDREPDPPVQAEPEREPEPVAGPAPDSKPASADVVVLRALERTDWGALALLGTAVVLGAGSVLLDGAIPQWPAYAHDRRVTAADFIPVAGYTLAVGALVAAVIDLADGPDE